MLCSQPQTQTLISVPFLPFLPWLTTLADSPVLTCYTTNDRTRSSTHPESPSEHHVGKKHRRGARSSTPITRTVAHVSVTWALKLAATWHLRCWNGHSALCIVWFCCTFLPERQLKRHLYTKGLVLTCNNSILTYNTIITVSCTPARSVLVRVGVIQTEDPKLQSKKSGVTAHFLTSQICRHTSAELCVAAAVRCSSYCSLLKIHLSKKWKITCSLCMWHKAAEHKVWLGAGRSSSDALMCMWLKMLCKKFYVFWPAKSNLQNQCSPGSIFSWMTDLICRGKICWCQISSFQSTLRTNKGFLRTKRGLKIVLRSITAVL